MSQQALLRQSFKQKCDLFYQYLYGARIFPALMLSLLLIALMTGISTLSGNAQPQYADQFPPTAVEQPAALTVALKTSGKTLRPEMRTVLTFAARKYHVSAGALESAFVAAQSASQETGLDPLLIIAVIAIESRFNPYAESVAGAQGLMQVMPRWHEDKIPEGMGVAALFDPEANVRIGAQILHESIRSEGGLIAGLQQFAGASDDPDLGYANKVLAQKRELEVAAGRVAMARL